MRKLLIVAIVVVALMGAYSFCWFKKADDLHHNVEDFIAQLNEQTKTFNQGSPVLRYESLNVSGFPFAITVELTKPVIDVPVSVILQQLSKKMSPDPTFTPAPNAPKEWMEEISYAGGIKISSNFMGDHFTLLTDGDRTNVTTVDHVVRHSLLGTSANPLLCHVAFERKNFNPTSLEPLFTDGRSFVEAFRSMDCSVDGVAIKDNSNQALLSSIDRFFVSTTIKPSDTDYRKASLNVDMKSKKMLPAFDAIVAEYMQLASAFLQKAPPYVPPYSSYGEQNIAIDIGYDGPVSNAAFADPDMHVSVDINKFDMQNAISESKNQMHVSSSTQGDERTAKFVIKTTSKVSEAYDTLITQVIGDAYSRMMKAQLAGKKSMPLPIADPQTFVAAFLPKFHELGLITFDMDATVKGPKGENFLKQGALTLSAFDIKTTPYGMTLKGSASQPTATGKMPTADMSLTLINADALLDALFAYGKRVEAVFATTGRPLMLSDALAGGVKRFVQGISEGNAKDWIIHLVVGDKGFTVSGKQIGDIMGLYATDIAPYLPQRAPASPMMIPPTTPPAPMIDHQ